MVPSQGGDIKETTSGEGRRDLRQAMRSRDEVVGHRHYPRFPVSIPVTGRCPKSGSQEFPGTVRNVSRGGLLAEFPASVAPGSNIHLVLQTRRGPLELSGQVAWVDAPGKHIRHGIAFPEPKGRAFAVNLLAGERA